MDINNKRSIGNFGEDAAIKYLQDNNYKIITRNYRIGRSNEIDIIARDGDYICFIEVKTRSSIFFGLPSESVNKRKQQKIIYIAGVYLVSKKIINDNTRFDVIEVIISNKNENLELREINHIKNAFES